MVAPKNRPLLEAVRGSRGVKQRRPRVAHEKRAASRARPSASAMHHSLAHDADNPRSAGQPIALASAVEADVAFAAVSLDAGDRAQLAQRLLSRGACRL